MTAACLKCLDAVHRLLFNGLVEVGKTDVFVVYKFVIDTVWLIDEGLEGIIIAVGAREFDCARGRQLIMVDGRNWNL